MENIPIPEAIETVYLLNRRGLTLSTAESLTGGKLAAAIVSVPGASAVFSGGVVSYTNDVKMKLLGVSPDTLEKHTAVSHETAREMAIGVRRACGTDVGVSTTGSAGPDPCDGVEPGRFFVGISVGDECESFEFFVESDREGVRAAAVEEALRAILGLV